MAPTSSAVTAKASPGYFVSICTRCFAGGGPAAAADARVTAVATATRASMACRAFIRSSFRETRSACLSRPVIDRGRLRFVSDEQQLLRGPPPRLVREERAEAERELRRICVGDIGHSVREPEDVSGAVHACTVEDPFERTGLVVRQFGAPIPERPGEIRVRPRRVLTRPEQVRSRWRERGQDVG